MEFLKDRLLDLKLSSCYTEDLQKVVTSFEIGYHLYADDSQLLDKTTLQNLDACRLRIGSCVESVREWCSSRRLQLNSDKTELIWFGTRSILSKFQGLETSIRVGAVEVKPVESVRDLGVTLDCQLNMWAHISKIVSACYYHLRRIRQLRHCLDKDDRQRLVSSLVLSRIDYCNVALAGLPATSLAPLQRVINAAARFVANLRPRDHVSPVLRDLHWLPIRERISYKVCLMMFNVVNGTAPTYMTGMVTRISDLPGRCHLRSAAKGLFDVPRTRTVFGSRAFSIAGPVAWNGLPAHVCAIRDVIPFKSALKTHFFQLAYANSL